MKDIVIRRKKEVLVDEHYIVPDDGMNAKQFIESIEKMLANHEEHKFFDHAEEMTEIWDNDAIVLDGDEQVMDFTIIDEHDDTLKK